MKKAKVIQISTHAGFDGPESGAPWVYVLYDNGEVWRCCAWRLDEEWEFVNTPDIEANTVM